MNSALLTRGFLTRVPKATKGSLAGLHSLAPARYLWESHEAG